MEMKTRGDDAGVVEDEQRILREIFCNVFENAVVDVTLSINQEFGLVALGERVEGDAIRGEVVGEVGKGKRLHVGAKIM